ncbi:MAG: hypothetical protein IPK16_32250 [Anaerolineales bacterium]|nr:hypothetical protein [Anaerolineales bacterium]
MAEPLGAVNLHQQTFNEGGLILAGLEGSIRYNTAPRYQYTQSEMWMNIWRLAPKLLINRIRYGRYLDVLVAHSPPWEIPRSGLIDRTQVFKSFLTSGGGSSRAICCMVTSIFIGVTLLLRRLMPRRR